MINIEGKGSEGELWLIYYNNVDHNSPQGRSLRQLKRPVGRERGEEIAFKNPHFNHEGSGALRYPLHHCEG